MDAYLLRIKYSNKIMEEPWYRSYKVPGTPCNLEKSLPYDVGQKGARN